MKTMKIGHIEDSEDSTIQGLNDNMKKNKDRLNTAIIETLKTWGQTDRQ